MWEYKIPTHIIFGEGALKKHPEEFNLGSKALIVAGRSSLRNNSLNEVREVLESSKIEYEIWDKVEPNPTFEQIDASLDADADFVFVIGIGGGSQLDAAKAISAVLASRKKVEELYDAGFRALPIIAIPTTAGTGTEVTPYSVLTTPEDEKRSLIGDPIFPKVSFLDPIYTETMPTKLTIDTGIDALSHLIEGIISKNSSPLTDILALEGINTVKEYLPSVIEEPNFENREKLLFASLIGGIVNANTGMTLIHALGYPLTSLKGLSHGRANGIVILEALKFLAGERKVEKALKPFNRGLKEFLFSIDNWKIELSEEEIDKYAEIVFKAKGNLERTPKRIRKEDIIKIYSNL